MHVWGFVATVLKFTHLGDTKDIGQLCANLFNTVI